MYVAMIGVVGLGLDACTDSASGEKPSLPTGTTSALSQPTTTTTTAAVCAIVAAQARYSDDFVSATLRLQNCGSGTLCMIVTSKLGLLGGGLARPDDTGECKMAGSIPSILDVREPFDIELTVSGGGAEPFVKFTCPPADGECVKLT